MIKTYKLDVLIGGTMNGTQNLIISYPWANALVLRATTKLIKRVGKGRPEGGEFAPQNTPPTGIEIADKARKSYDDWNRMRVKVAKLEKRAKESPDLKFKLDKLTMDRDALRVEFDKAKKEAEEQGHKINSRGVLVAEKKTRGVIVATTPVTKSPITELTDNPIKDLQTRIEAEKLLESIERSNISPIFSGGTVSDPGRGKMTSDAPKLETFADGSHAVWKGEGTNQFHHAATEVLASRLSALLGVGNVPVTAMVEGGSRQSFVENSKVASQEIIELLRIELKSKGIDMPESGIEFQEARMLYPDGKEKYGEKYQEQIEQIRILDRVLGNSDRHNGNVMQSDGVLYAIDSGRACIGWSKRLQKTRGDSDQAYFIDTNSRKSFGHEPGISFYDLPPKIKERWSKITKNDFDKVFEGLTFGGETNGAWERFEEIREIEGLKFFSNAPI